MLEIGGWCNAKITKLIATLPFLYVIVTWSSNHLAIILTHSMLMCVIQNRCVNTEKSHYSGTVNGTINIVVGAGGYQLNSHSPLQTDWSTYKVSDFGFGKLTAFNHSSLLFEYKRSSDGEVYDQFTISRDYRDVLASVHDGCEPTTLLALWIKVIQQCTWKENGPPLSMQLCCYSY